MTNGGMSPRGMVEGALVFGLTVWLASLGGCQAAKYKTPTTSTTVVVTGCEHFGLITASRLDTAETRQQIVAHNAEYLKTCGAP